MAVEHVKKHSSYVFCIDVKGLLRIIVKYSLGDIARRWARVLAKQVVVEYQEPVERSQVPSGKDLRLTR